MFNKTLIIGIGILLVLIFVLYLSGVFGKNNLENKSKDEIDKRIKDFFISDYAAAKKKWNMSPADFINLRRILKFEPSDAANELLMQKTEEK